MAWLHGRHEGGVLLRRRRQLARVTGVPGKIYEFSEINLDLTVESDAKCVHWVAQPIPHVLTERYFA